MQNLASHLQGAGCLLSFGKLRDALAASWGGRTIRFEPFEKEIWPLLKSLDIVGARSISDTRHFARLAAP